MFLFRNCLGLFVASVCLLALCTTSQAGPFGFFGRSAGGSCGAGGCGGGGSSSMMQSGWGSAPMMPTSPAPVEVLSNRTLDFYVNAERAHVGLPPVVVDDKISANLLATLAANAGDNVRASLPAANLARNGTAMEVVQSWMKNDQARTRLLSPDYKTCGYAKAVGSDGKTYWALAMGK